MTDIAAELRSLHPNLVSHAVQVLAKDGQRLGSIETEVSRFYDRLSESAKTGSNEGLCRLVQEWMDALPMSADGDKPSFLPVWHTLRQCTWEVLAQALPANRAAQAVIALEPLLAGTSSFLGQREYEARIERIQVELLAARDKLEKLDKSKSDFIAVAAHELKTPLTLIEGYTQLLARELPLEHYPTVDVHLRGLGNGTQRLREIIDDMIDVSLIDNAMLELHYESLRLNELLARTRQDMRPALRQRRLTLAIKEVDPGLLTYADAGRLWQAFNNILENAIKFTPDGGRVTVGTRLLPGFIEITIADTGIGIALEHQERIFEKFGSVGNIALHSTGKTKFKGGGPGLGLPIARGIIEAHGGKIWVVSPGHDERACPGSTFHIMLPHLDAAPPDKTLKLFDPFPQIQAVIQRKHDDARPHSAPPS